MLGLVLAAAVMTAPAPSNSDEVFMAPETLYQMNWFEPLENNCKPVDMNATFDALQDEITAEDGHMMGKVYGFYDGPTFVFMIVTVTKEDGRLRGLEEIYPSDRAYCLEHFQEYYEEMRRVMAGGKITRRGKLLDFTVSAIGSDGVKEEQPHSAAPQR
jgi:hypothetical protein